MKIASSQVALTSQVEHMSLHSRSTNLMLGAMSPMSVTKKDSQANPDKDVQDETTQGKTFLHFKEMAENALKDAGKSQKIVQKAEATDNRPLIKIPDMARGTLRLLVTLLKSIGNQSPAIEELEKLLGDEDKGTQDAISDFFGVSSQENNFPFINSSVPGGIMYNATSVDAEFTSVSFKGQGTAITEDGRTLDFNVELEMTSSFIQVSQIQQDTPFLNLCDPLVINVGSEVTAVSDKKFTFDLNNDGNMDQISTLNSGFGFLSYDKNGNGKIDDGSELFGTSSGNGFKDLMAYDSDNNGWIDENDDVWDKLTVWFKNADGKDELKSLKDADIGAIYLGSVMTPLNLRANDDPSNLNGAIRRSGFFLRESRGSGLIQHVDLAM